MNSLVKENVRSLLTQPFRFDKISYVAPYLFECPGRMLSLLTQSFRTGIKEIPEKKQGIHALRGSSNAVNGVSLIPPFYHPTLKGWVSICHRHILGITY